MFAVFTEKRIGCFPSTVRAENDAIERNVSSPISLTRRTCIVDRNLNLTASVIEQLGYREKKQTHNSMRCNSFEFMLF